MKLISKTLLNFLLISLPLLIIAGFFSYYLIKSELRDGTEEELSKEKVYAEKLIQTFKNPQTVYLTLDSLSSIQPFKGISFKSSYTDTLIFDITENENVGYRKLKSYYSFNGNEYQIILLKTTMQEDELLEGIFSAFTIISLFLMIAFFIVNWLVSKALWKPFYNTLSKLNTYDIKNHEQQQFLKTNTLEFQQLNTALTKMTDKIHIDYLQQKEFTENASHKMQTPLAVIKTNLTQLMQSTTLSESDMNNLQTIENTTKKMASLNKALILLSKIENNQFKENELISVNKIINKVINNFADLIEVKNIKLNLNLKDDLQLTINPTLTEILLSNLVQNAIRHNVNGGIINIDLMQNKLIISNSSEALTINSNELFTRFKKNDASKDSLGLGLAIVKSICNIYQLNIDYSYSNQLHTFTLNSTKDLL
ncbi:MAG: HAMP domain-containing histidine kinase [Bacteroidetes bacterium]|nr:HAMP domain-containing histidine kinase [Bacteroidota bacterium]